MQTIERVIILSLLRHMRDEGYQPVAVWNGECYELAEKALVSYRNADKHPKPQFMTDVEVLAAIDSVCESTLHFTHHNARTWGNRGVLLILGNGVDVICDHHVAKNEPFEKIMSGISNRLSDGELP